MINFSSFFVLLFIVMTKSLDQSLLLDACPGLTSGNLIVQLDMPSNTKLCTSSCGVHPFFASVLLVPFRHFNRPPLPNKVLYYVVTLFFFSCILHSQPIQMPSQRIPSGRRKPTFKTNAYLRSQLHNWNFAAMFLVWHRYGYSAFLYHLSCVMLTPKKAPMHATFPIKPGQ